jgi:predicted GNAT superfamily acetyltransferase
LVTGRGRNWLVAIDVTGALGFADFNWFRDRSGGRFISDDGVYASENVRGQGVDKERVVQLFEVTTRPTFARSSP